MGETAQVLNGRRVVVTGASRGIGAAVAERFAAEGAAVVVVARTVDRHPHLGGSLNETLSRCRGHGAKAEALAADLSDGHDRARVISDAATLLGGHVEILVNNAAAAIYQPLSDYPLKRRRLSFEVNVHAPFDLLQDALPGMITAGEGWVVNLSSATSSYLSGTATQAGGPSPTMGVYGASKAALERLTFSFAKELYGTGVRLNCVAPASAVLTEGTVALMGDSLDPAKIEPMETMVESILLLATCGEDMTGGVHRSLALLSETGREVKTLDGRGPFTGSKER